jgi:hypothetical protein
MPDCAHRGSSEEPSRGFFLGGSHHAIPRHLARSNRRLGSDHRRRFQAAHAMANGRNGRWTFPGFGSGGGHPVGGVSVRKGRDQDQRDRAVSGGTAAAIESAALQGRCSSTTAPLAAATATAATAATAPTAAATTAATTATAPTAATPGPRALGEPPNRPQRLGAR